MLHTTTYALWDKRIRAFVKQGIPTLGEAMSLLRPGVEVRVMSEVPAGKRLLALPIEDVEPPKGKTYCPFCGSLLRVTYAMRHLRRTCRNQPPKKVVDDIVAEYHATLADLRRSR